MSVLSPPCFLGSHCALALQLETDNTCIEDWKKLITLHYLFHHQSPITTVKSVSVSLKETWMNHLAILSRTVDSLIPAVCHGPLKTALMKWNSLCVPSVFWSKVLCRCTGGVCVMFCRIIWTVALLVCGSSGPHFCSLLVLLFRGLISPVQA